METDHQGAEFSFHLTGSTPSSFGHQKTQLIKKIRITRDRDLSTLWRFTRSGGARRSHRFQFKSENYISTEKSNYLPKYSEIIGFKISGQASPPVIGSKSKSHTWLNGEQTVPQKGKLRFYFHPSNDITPLLLWDPISFFRRKSN